MGTVEHMRNVLLAAAFLAYRKTGSYDEAARLLCHVPACADVHGWLVEGVTPDNDTVFERYAVAKRILQDEIGIVSHRMAKFSQPADSITVRGPGDDEAR